MAGLSGAIAAVTGAIASSALIWVGYRWLRNPEKLRRMGEAMGHTGWYGRFVARAVPVALLVFGVVSMILIAVSVLTAVEG